jgi:hypothetical protein
MESSVASQKTSKIYSAPLSKLYKGDVDAQSELFEINIFNTVIHIAPGKSIAGDDGLVYFYVYAIKDEKVVANLGVYELITDEQKELYDISTFDDLLLFDYYYTTPAKIKEFEIKGNNNIFEYIDTHLEIDTDKKKIVSLYNQFISYAKAEKDALGDNYKLYYNVLTILSSTIRTTGIPKETLDNLKEKCDTEKKKPLEQLKISLAILEPFYNVHFLFIDNGETVSNFRYKTPPQTFKPKKYIIVSTDQTFVSTSSTMKEPEEVEKEDEDDEEDKPEKDESKKEAISKVSKVTLEDGEVEEDEEEDEEDEQEDEDKVESKKESTKPKESTKLKSASSKTESTVEAKSEVKSATVEKSKPKLTPRVRIPKSKNNEPKAEAKAEAKLSVIPEGSKESKELKSKLKSAAESLPKAEAKESKADSLPKESKKLKSSKEPKTDAKESKADAKESKPENTSAPSAPRKLKTKAP